MMRRDEAANVDYLLEAMRQRRGMIAIMAVLAMGTAAAVSLREPALYEADASLFVKFGREYMYQPEIGEETPWVPFRATEAMNSEIEILNSRHLKEQVVDSLGPGTIYGELDRAAAGAHEMSVGEFLKSKLATLLPSKPVGAQPFRDPAAIAKDQAIRKLEANMEVLSPKESSVIHVSYVHSDPEMARRVLGALITAYENERVQIYGMDHLKALSDQAERYRGMLREAERALEDYKQSNRVADVEAQAGALAMRERELELALGTIRVDTSALERNIELLRDPSPAGTIAAAGVLRPELADMTIQRWMDLQLQEQEAISQHGPTSGVVARLQKEIERIGTLIEEQKSVEVIRSQNDLVRKQAEAAQVEKDLEDVRERMKALALHGVRVADLARQVDFLAHNYVHYKQLAEDARVGQALDDQRLTSVRVLQPPMAGLESVSASAAVRVGVAGMVGALIGALLAFFLGPRDRRGGTPEAEPVASRSLGI